MDNREFSKPLRSQREIQKKFDLIEKLTEQLLEEEAKILDALNSNTSELANEVEHAEAKQRKILECIQSARID